MPLADEYDIKALQEQIERILDSSCIERQEKHYCFEKMVEIVVWRVKYKYNT